MLTINQDRTKQIQLDTHFKDLFPVNEEMVSRISESIQKKGYDKSQPLHVWKEGMLFQKKTSNGLRMRSVK
ncbi:MULTISPECIES: hypothetical protein [unclassified Treponema]|uniref:hypothetical protein n=1 Tax=unclassified Treponema TaxID=2638727 RepID=UPI00053015A3|nr:MULTISPECIES: hypothetical protein [unclassified Treponema]AIW88723.1 hypothetical protein JO41_02015 [Treponema sp. OMZ 838]UTC44721.1 hypothetical protein E4N66_11890 [Treponema sp. OMZ 857]UTC49813.1 hypothetical protein E4N65_06765 [Treponema sp. OMZ 855]